MQSQQNIVISQRIIQLMGCAVEPVNRNNWSPFRLTHRNLNFKQFFHRNLSENQKRKGLPLQLERLSERIQKKNGLHLKPSRFQSPKLRDQIQRKNVRP